MGYKLRSWLSGLVVGSMLLVTLPAQAGMIATEQLAGVEAREASLVKVQEFVARADVQQQLEGWGVESTLAAERVAALTDAELQQLVQTIDQQPAGGDGALTIIGIVFLVLLILELVGVTNVFSGI